MIFYSNVAFTQISKNYIQFEISKIYKEYRDSCAIYRSTKVKPLEEIRYKKMKNPNSNDYNEAAEKYHKAYDQYLNYTITQNRQKIEKLKNLVQKVEEKKGVIGNTFYYLCKDANSVMKIDKINEEAKDKNKIYIAIHEKDEIHLIRNLESVNQIRKDFLDTFKYSYLDGYDGRLSTMITFLLDVDGYPKKISASEGDEEFNLLCVLAFYSINKKYEPSLYKNQPILEWFKVPVTLVYE